MKRIGILGGAFDPPHLGHLQIAKAVQERIALDEIWFMPTYIAPHKDRAESNAKDRAEMVQLAIAHEATFILQTIELERKGKSYTIDTMRQLKQLYPSYEFYFIIGADMVMSLHTWKDIDELIKLVTFIGVSRPGYQLETTLPVKIIELDTYPFSSSDIRERVTKGLPFQHMVPKTVYQYIKEQRLYGYRKRS